MRRDSGGGGWMALADFSYGEIILFIFLNVLLLTGFQANANEIHPIEAQISFSGDASGQTITLQHARHNREHLLVPLNLKKQIEDEFLRVMRQRFLRVESTSNASNPNSDVVITVDVSNSGYDSSYENASIHCSVNFGAVSSSGQRFNKPFTLESKGTFEFNALSFDTISRGLKKTIPELFKTKLVEEFSKFLDASDTAQFITDIEQEHSSSGIQLAQLEALTATYRVTEDGANIKKLPDTRSRLIRKVALGS